MAKNRSGNRRIASIILGVACLAVAGGVGWSLFGNRPDSLAMTAAETDGQATASIDPATRAVGATGLPLPRFVSLKAEKVNVRRGPSSEHPVAWVFQRKGMPVEIVAEFENWRRIRDSEGEEGWILQNMLSGKRTAMVAPWRQKQTMPIYSSPATSSGMVARLGAGVVSEVENCTGQWCQVAAGGYEGWIQQSMLWGVYPGETID